MGNLGNPKSGFAFPKDDLPSRTGVIEKGWKFSSLQPWRLQLRICPKRGSIAVATSILFVWNSQLEKGNQFRMILIPEDLTLWHNSCEIKGQKWAHLGGLNVRETETKKPNPYGLPTWTSLHTNDYVTTWNLRKGICLLQMYLSLSL